jgi:hypothetical protein
MKLALSLPEVQLSQLVVIMRKMGDRVGHVQILATLALAPAIITAWFVLHVFIADM